ncbi:SurA N-terminal domain-containing protein [Defluviimonas sp. WL0002]|uniref:SurA N-terminal domain-containing protein n=1 Tax=Albidovulum marisflavi TaxID=2984159 RepID=A0ABT2ZBV9_9RHOB|nr:peptidylprolyl isomerase [Defluviimonas sp. WL0002]MCV2868586.1 SurA N-terminal domain-containing protein [Defluviimonas sp. WL0002]
MSTKLRNNKGKNTVIWILMGLMVAGLGGYGVTNFGAGIGSIGSVGGRDVDLRDYARALNQEVRAMSAQLGTPISFAQAQQFGVTARVQAQLFAATALDGEADDRGLSVGDAEVRRQVTGIQAFRGLDGSFDREAYKLTLRQEGLTEAEFEMRLRADAARGLLQRAIIGAAAAPETFLTSVANWTNETRDFTLAELIASDLDAPVEAPSEDALKAYYDTHPEDYTKPETRQITYVWLSPEMVQSDIEIDEATLRNAYEERIDEFVVPEKRLVERLVFASEDEAKAAKARLESGEVSFEQLTAERGLTLADIDLGEMSRQELGAAGDAVFAMEEPGVVGPLPSNLGPALFAMNGILAAQETSFEEARDMLLPELTIDRARRLILDRSESMADVLAGGSTLEQVAEQEKMQLGQIEFNTETSEGIAAYADFRDAAEQATAEDFPQLVELEDGGVFALRLDGIDPPTVRPMDDVREALIADWIRAETHSRLLAKATEVQAALDNGSTLAALGLVTTHYDGFARSGHLADTPGIVAERAFELEEGKASVVDAAARVFVVQVDAIHAADAAEAASYANALEPRIEQSVAGDMLELFTTALENEKGVTVDQSAINAVHAQMQ